MLLKVKHMVWRRPCVSVIVELAASIFSAHSTCILLPSFSHIMLFIATIWQPESKIHSTVSFPLTSGKMSRGGWSRSLLEGHQCHWGHVSYIHCILQGCCQGLPLTYRLPWFQQKLAVSWSTLCTASIVVNGVLLPSIALNCLPGCYTRMFNCSGILD
jgi:hypothetical protein